MVLSGPAVLLALSFETTCRISMLEMRSTLKGKFWLKKLLREGSAGGKVVTGPHCF